MKKDVLDNAVRSGRTLVYHYIGVFYYSPSDEFDVFCNRLRYFPGNYLCIAAVDCTDPESAFRCTQDWDGRRSTSHGDLVRTPDGKWWLCLRVGWKDVTSIIYFHIRDTAWASLAF